MPPEQSVSALRISAVMIAVAFTLTGLYTGSELSQSLGLRVGIHSTLVGSVILGIMSVPAAMVGARTRLSTYMIVSQVFGRGGAKLINLVLATALLGWYAVTADLFGHTFFVTAAQWHFTAVPEWVYTIASSVLVIATTVFGFKAVDRLSLLAAPLLVVLTLYVAYRSLAVHSWDQLMGIPGTKIDFDMGVSAVVGGWIVNVLLMPDFTRYSRTTVDCAVIGLAGNGIGSASALILAMIPALAFSEIDPMKYMAVLGLVGIAFVILVVSTWSINAINLYSIGLVSSAVVRRVSYGRLVILTGAVGTVAALLKPGDRLIAFLVLLGVIVPPIVAIYLTDFFILRRQDFALAGEGENAKNNVNAILACTLGAAVGVTMYVTNTSLTGVPTIESFVSACLAYCLAELIRIPSRRDRQWRSLAG